MDDLARRLASGEPSAFERLYDLYAGRVHRYLLVRAGSRSDADDLLQDVFVRLARTRRTLASVENLAAYVFATARNEASRLTERRARELGRRSGLAVDALADEARGRGAAGIEDADWAAFALAQLDPELREVVALKIYGGLTLREIGEATGMPQGTVATRYRSALMRLREQLVEEPE